MMTCLGHKCIEKGCFMPRLCDISTRCARHACIVAKCDGLRIEGTKWCSEHTCGRKDCKNSGEGGYCINHRCRFAGCWKPRLNDKKGRYCVAHSCAVEKCPFPSDPTSLRGWYCGYHKKQYSLEKPDECAVCLEDIGNEIPWECGHYIHRGCITRSLKAQCPICRTELALTKEEMNEIEKRNGKAEQEQYDESFEFQYSDSESMPVQSILAIHADDLIMELPQ
jgi:Ring finger domain